MKTLREQAEELAYSLGISFYLRGDRLFAKPPGERIEPPANAHPVPHGAIDLPSEGEVKA